MKTLIQRNLPLLYLILISFQVQAQSWRTLREGEVYHYSGHRFIWVDSMTTAGPDSLFHMAREADPTTIAFNECGDMTLPRDFGFSLTREAGGTEVFTAQDGSEWRIDPSTPQYAYFPLYAYPNGDEIRATFMTRMQITLSGQTDSVRSYILSAHDSGGLLLSGHPVTGKEIRLSEHWGLTLAYPFYLPADSIDWSQPMELIGFEDQSGQIGEGNLQASEIFDFSVGDIIEFETGTEQPIGPGQGWGRTSHHREVLAVSLNGNTVTVSYHERSYTELHWGADTSYFSESYPVESHDLSPNTLNTLPGKVLVAPAASGRVNWYINLPAYQPNGRESKAEQAFYWEPDSSCYFNGSESILRAIERKSDIYYLGLGGPYYDRVGVGQMWWKRLKYFKKGSETWGTPIPILMGREDSAAASHTLLSWPNPAEGVLFVEVPGSGCLHLADLSGREFMALSEVQAGTQRLELDHLPPGFYLLRWQGEDGRVLHSRIVHR